MSAKKTLSETIPPTVAVLTADQGAALLQVDRRPLERWAAQDLVLGRLTLPGRSVRFSHDAIENWLAGE